MPPKPDSYSTPLHRRIDACLFLLSVTIFTYVALGARSVHYSDDPTQQPNKSMMEVAKQ